MDFFESLLIWFASCSPFLIPLVIPIGSYGFYKHAARHTDGTDDIRNATTDQKGLATAAQIAKLESALQNLIEDLTPQLNANLDMKDHSINNVLSLGLTGGQIAFPAAQQESADENTLDDYEEGMWTAVIRGSGTAGTYEITDQMSNYTKIGRVVHLESYIIMAAAITGGGDGYLQITGCPFAKITDSFPAGSVILEKVDFTGTYVGVCFISSSESSIFYLVGITDNATKTPIPIAGLSAGDKIQFSITFFV